MAKQTARESLDCMVEHVRFEVLQILDFMSNGNVWPFDEISDQRRAWLAHRSIVEAGLIHLRCIIEFLGDKAAPDDDRIKARHYLPDWQWKASTEIERVGMLSDRVAHLGVKRCESMRGSDWTERLTGNAPIVIDGFRKFLSQLGCEDEARLGLFMEPDDQGRSLAEIF